MFSMPIAMIQRILAPWGPGKDASTTASPKTIPNSGEGEQNLEKRLARHTEERNVLERDAKLSAVLIAVLLVLTIEYTPLVAADFQLEDQYGDQVRSLVHVDGLVTRLDTVLTASAPTWEERVSVQVDTAMRRIDELDFYDQVLVSDEASGLVRPQFLDECIGRNTVDEAWVATSIALRNHWPVVVQRCIIERMGADFDADGQGESLAPLFAANTDVSTAIAAARREFPLFAWPVSPTSGDPSLPPAAEPVEITARKAFDVMEAEIANVIRTVKAGPEEAISPPPADWVTQFTGADGSLRSFRDNLLMTYANPIGATTSNRSDPAVRLSISQIMVSSEATPDLKKALTGVRESQKALQDSVDERMDDLEAAIPDPLKPVLIVAKPKYLVLSFPLLVALVGAYLLWTYTRVQREARELRAAGATELSLSYFVALVLAPLFLLLGLFFTYDWPQFVHSWWHWAYQGPLLFFMAIVLACAYMLRPLAAVADGGESTAPAAPSVQSEPAQEAYQAEAPDSGLSQTSVG